MASLDSLADDVTDLKVSVARMEERQELQPELFKAAIREAIDEALAPLHNKVETLEKDLSRLKVYGGLAAAALGGAAKFALDNLPKLFGGAFAIGLLSCSALPDQAGFLPALRPVSVLIPDSLPSDCHLAIDRALEFWAPHVDYLAPMAVSSCTPARLGEISLCTGTLEPGYLGWADTITTTNGRVTRSDITLASCDWLTVAHELGHALGLDHDPDTRNLMFFLDAGGTELTAEQLESVR